MYSRQKTSASESDFGRTRITNYERHRQSIFVHVTTVESAAFLAQLKKANEPKAKPTNTNEEPKDSTIDPQYPPSSTSPLYRSIPAPIYYLLSLLPIATATLAVYIITTCAQLTFDANILPKEMKFPPISMFSLRPNTPEQTLSQWGFPAVSILFLCATIPISSYFLSNTEEEQKDAAWKASWTSAIAFVGLAIHGIIPLHEDILEMINGRPESGNGTMQSTVHQVAAAFFFMLSMYHGFVVCQLLWSTDQLPTGWKQSGVLGKISFIIKCITLVMQLLPSATGLLFHPATLMIFGIKETMNDSDKGGLSQW